MLPYQPAFAEAELALACVPLPAAPPLFVSFFSGFLASPFFAANFLAFSFSFTGVAWAFDFFFSGVALGFGDAFFFGLGLGEAFGDGFGVALADGVGVAVGS